MRNGWLEMSYKNALKSIRKYFYYVRKYFKFHGILESTMESIRNSYIINGFGFIKPKIKKRERMETSSSESKGKEKKTKLGPLAKWLEEKGIPKKSELEIFL